MLSPTHDKSPPNVGLLFWFFPFLATPRHMQVPRPGVESKLELQPTPQLWRCQFLNPLCPARTNPCPCRCRDPTNLTMPQGKFLVLFIYLFLVFLGLHPQHMDRPSQARGLIRAAAARLHHSTLQRRILNPLSKARDRTPVLMDTSQFPYRSHNGNSQFCYFPICAPRPHFLSVQLKA